MAQAELRALTLRGPPMESSTFGLQVADAGGDLPKEWQALIASTTSMLGALLSRMRTTAATQRQRVLGP